jgi:hypothetical protein
VNRTAVDLFGVRVITIRPRVLVCLVDDEMEEPSAMYRTLCRLFGGCNRVLSDSSRTVKQGKITTRVKRKLRWMYTRQSRYDTAPSSGH